MLQGELTVVVFAVVVISSSESSMRFVGDCGERSMRWSDVSGSGLRSTSATCLGMEKLPLLMTAMRPILSKSQSSCSRVFSVWKKLTTSSNLMPRSVCCNNCSTAMETDRISARPPQMMASQSTSTMGNGRLLTKRVLGSFGLLCSCSHQFRRALPCEVNETSDSPTMNGASHETGSINNENIQ